MILRILFGSAFVFGIALGLTAQAQAAHPRVIRTSPANGATDVDPGTKRIAITFNQSMDTNIEDYMLGADRDTYEAFSNPRWLNPMTLVLDAELESNHDYTFIVNGILEKGCRNRRGEVAVPHRVFFATTSAHEDESVDEQANAKAVGELIIAITEQYSHRDRLGIDWEARINDRKTALIASETLGAFAYQTARLLEAAKDSHLWVSADSKNFPVYTPQRQANINLATLKKTLPEYRQLPGNIWIAEYEDGIGYIRIPTWDRENPETLPSALKALRYFAEAEAPGLIIDVRTNGGGYEVLAGKFAACFVDRKVRYAKSDKIDPNSDTGFTRVVTRTLKPSRRGPTYRGKTALLIGPMVASSCESFVMMMRQVPDCKTFGTTTAGSSGLPKPHKLSNGVTVHLSSWRQKDLRGMSIEGKGIKPDVRVPTTPAILTKHDPVIEAALKYLDYQPEGRQTAR